MFRKRRQIKIVDKDFAGHQLIEQRPKQGFEHGTLSPVQIDLAIDGLEDGDDFALLIEHSRQWYFNSPDRSNIQVLLRKPMLGR
jgi:hypothetical protein